MSWWTEFRKTITNPKNITATVLLPFTAGGSALMYEDNNGYNVLDHLRGKPDIDEQNEFNANQAQLNRDWQEQMSNTAYQRGYADLMTAGLNPNLAGGSGGASTPTGAQATSAGLPESPGALLSNVATAGANMATGLKTLEESKYIGDTAKAEIGKTIADTAKAQAETQLTDSQVQMARKSFEILSEEDQIRQATLLDRFERASHSANAQKEMARIQKEWIHTSWGNRMYTQGLNLGQIGQILNPITNAAIAGGHTGGGLTINTAPTYY